MTQDELKTHVLEHLHAGPDGYRSLVRDLAVAWPELPARSLETALGTAAAEMDAAIRRDGGSTNEARTARRLAILLNLDIERLSAEGGPTTLGALLARWRQEDDFFLRL